MTRRAALALLLLGPTLAAALIPAGGAAAQVLRGHGAAARPAAVARAQQADAAPGAISLTTVSPTLLTPQGTLLLAGTVLNTSPSTLESPGVRLRVRRQPLSSRGAVQAWATADEEVGSGVPVGPTVPLGARLAPGARAAFQIKVPAADLGLGPLTGARGVAVQLLGDSGEGLQAQSLLRTYVAWQPGVKQYAAQPVTFLVPITGLPDAGPDGVLSVREAATGVGPGSRLRALVDAPWPTSVGWAVDPALLEALDTLGSAGGTGTSAGGTPSPTTGVGQPDGQDGGDGTGNGQPDPALEQDRATILGFLADLRERAVGRDVVELPYGDPDLAAVADAGHPELLEAARSEAGGTVSRVLATTPQVDVAWPADGWADAATVRTAHRFGASAVVLDAATRPLTVPTSYTPAARADLGNGVQGLLYDHELSTELAATSITDPARTTLGVQRFLAETLTATMDRPGETRHLLVVAPRQWTPDPTSVGRLMTAVAQAGWLGSLPLHDLRTSPHRPTTAARRTATRAAPAVRRAQLSGTAVREVSRLRADLVPVGQLVDDAAGLTQPLAQESLLLLSNRWRGSPAARGVQEAALRDRVHALSDGVHVLPSRVNFLANEGEVQLTVQNNLTVPVHGVGVRVRSGNPRLEVTREPKPVTVEPGRRATVSVPVRALAGGVVTLSAQVVTPQGGLVGDPVDVQLQVTPTDVWALWVLGGVAALVVVIGLVRALRGPRRRARAAALAEALRGEAA